MYTLLNNVVNILINNCFRRNVVNKNEFEQFQIRFLQFQNKTFEFRLNNIEKNINNINYRREHNNNYYRHNVKRTNKFKKFKTQLIINYNNLIN